MTVTHLMKAVFVTSDGREFPTEEKAVAYEKFAADLAFALSEMPTVEDPHHCDFANGDGYRTWDAAVVERTRDRLLALMRTKHPDLATYDRKAYYVGRMLSDCGSSLYGPYMRLFYCIDSRNREWGQPYYATHSEGKQVEFVARGDEETPA